MLRRVGRGIAQALAVVAVGLGIAVASAVALAGTAAAGPSAAAIESGPVPADVQLHVGDSATLDGGALQVTLTQVAEDSRCPMDVTCVWMGRAVVALRVVVDGVDRGEVTVTLYPSPRNQPSPELDATVERYIFSLTDLQPYPRAGQPQPLDQRVATLHVRPWTP